MSKHIAQTENGTMWMVCEFSEVKGTNSYVVNENGIMPDGDMVVYAFWQDTTNWFVTDFTYTYGCDLEEDDAVALLWQIMSNLERHNLSIENEDDIERLWTLLDEPEPNL